VLELEQTLEKLIALLKKYREEALRWATGIEERREFFKQLVDIVIMDVEQLKNEIIELARRIDELEQIVYG